MPSSMASVRRTDSTNSSSSSSASNLSGSAKLDDVTQLMNSLKLDLSAKNLLPTERDAYLERLKVHGRKVENANPIFTKEGIEILCRHSFESNSVTTSREALRCLANALFLKAETRQIFVDLGYAGKAAERLKNENSDDEFLISRILFLLTYETNLDFDRLLEEHQLAESIIQNINRHSKQHAKSSKKSHATEIDDMALSETLKLLFNITHYYPDRAESFYKIIPSLLKILSRIKTVSHPLQPPVNYIINALMNLDLDEKKCGTIGTHAMFPKFDQKSNAEHLINILDQAIMEYKEADLDQLATPLVTLIRKVYEVAPQSVQRYMQWLLLPSDEERSRPLGQSDTLSSRLLKLSSSAMLPTLRESISSMMFELSDKDADSFVRNVGYGFASGFLMSHNVPIPHNATQAFSKAGEKGESSSINPITGQMMDREPQDTGPEMTEDEKEREAEKLFVLFERLKRTGVVDVKNPVEQAVDEGRFQELD